MGFMISIIFIALSAFIVVLFSRRIGRTRLVGAGFPAPFATGCLDVLVNLGYHVIDEDFGSMLVSLKHYRALLYKLI